MVCEVTYGVLIRLCEVCNLEVILVVEVIDSLHDQLTRVTLLHILRDVAEHHAVGLHATLPVAVCEALRATMEVVRAIVHLKAVLHAVDGHLAARDTTRHATHALATRCTIANVARRLHIAECHIVNHAIAVGELNAHDRGADVAKLHLRATAVAHGVEDDALALGRRAPYML